VTQTQLEPILLDVKGLACPMPLLKAKKTLNEMAPAELLRVFEVFSQQSGNQLLESRQEGDTYIYLIRKKTA